MSETAALDDFVAYYGDLYRIDLPRPDPDAYFESQMDWRPFKAQKDRSKHHAEKTRGVTLILKLRAVFNSASKAELAERKTRADELQRKYVEDYERSVEEERSLYLRQQEQHNQQVVERKCNFLDGDPDAVFALFNTVLAADGAAVENLEAIKNRSDTQNLKSQALYPYTAAILSASSKLTSVTFRAITSNLFTPAPAHLAALSTYAPLRARRFSSRRSSRSRHACCPDRSGNVVTIFQ